MDKRPLMDSFLIHGKLENDEDTMTMKDASFIDVLSINNAAYILAYGNAHCRKDPEKAISLFKKAIQYGCIFSYCNLADIYYHLGRNESAIRYYDIAVGYGDSTAMNNLAHLYNSKNDRDKATKLYEKALENGCETSAYNLGLLRELDGNTTEAIRLLERAVGNKSTEVSSVKKLSYFYRKNKYTNHAKHLAIEPPKKKKILARVYSELTDDCSFCLDKLMGTESGILILTCGHAYHNDCFGKKCSVCPLCVSAVT
jgi:tetratricopeptide (TPR) repeat protein